MIVNPTILALAGLQMVAGVYGMWLSGQPKVGAVMILVGIANVILSTVRA